MYKYYLGIDGGGSKTHCALFLQNGDLVDFLEWGTTSHEFLQGGYNDLNCELGNMFDSLKNRNQLNWEDVRVVYGMAGVDCNSQKEQISGFIKNHGVANCLLCNDSYLGIKAGSSKSWGICSMNGSGTGASGIDINGNISMVGGLFELSGDYAGGRILGGEVVRVVYEMLYKKGSDTALGDLLKRELCVIDTDDLFEKIICTTSDNSMQAKSFAPLLFEAANAHDEVALSILCRCGQNNARDIMNIADKLDFSALESIPVVLLGSLYTKASNQHIIDSLKLTLEQEDLKNTYEIIKLSVEPVVGAVLWAMEDGGIKLDKNLLAQQIANAIKYNSKTS